MRISAGHRSCILHGELRCKCENASRRNILKRRACRGGIPGDSEKDAGNRMQYLRCPLFLHDEIRECSPPSLISKPDSLIPYYCFRRWRYDSQILLRLHGVLTYSRRSCRRQTNQSALPLDRPPPTHRVLAEPGGLVLRGYHIQSRRT
jgi:hypothetical protein